jgi:hypothetical protein
MPVETFKKPQILFRKRLAIMREKPENLKDWKQNYCKNYRILKNTKEKLLVG